MRLRDEVRELGLGTEAAREHLLRALASEVGAVIGALAFDVRGGRERGIQAVTLVGFEPSTMPLLTVHQQRGRKFNPVCRVQLAHLTDQATMPGFMTTGSSAELVERAEWERSEFVNEYARPAHVAHWLGSMMVLAPGTTEGMALMRAAGDRPFTEEDSYVVALAREGLWRLFGRPIALAPRVQETLDVLLEGASDKEIAARLGLSPHTVRQYVKAIYRAYDVKGRAQLLARFAAGKTEPVADSPGARRLQ
jgi:DNA-binding CsgD family transcriptional regulator